MRPLPSVLNKKVFRELWQMKGPVLAIAFVIAGGVAVCVMSILSYSTLSTTRAQYYDEYRFAEVFTTLKRAPRHLLERVAEIPGIADVSDRVEGGAKLRMAGFDEPVSARVISLPETGQPSLNRLFVHRGRLPAPGRSAEVAVIGSFAEAHKLEPGDRFPAIINGREQMLTLTGVVESPEFIFVIPPGGLLPDFQRFGVLWMSRADLAAALDMEGAFNSLVVRIQPGSSQNGVIDALDRVFARFGTTGAFAREDQTSHRFLNDDLEQLKIMATMLPAIFMSVAMFLLNVVISRLVNTQRDIIAVLKAFGYTTRQIAIHYSKLVLVIAALGLALGIGLGLWLGRALSELYMEFYRFPGLTFQLPAVWLVLLVLLTFVVSLLGGWRAIRQGTARPPAEAMRPEGPAAYTVTTVETWFSGFRWSQPSRMIVRQLARRPIRAFLSVIGIAMATATVLVGNFQFDSVALMVQTQFASIQQQDMTATLVEPVNAAALYGLQRQPGVRYAEGRRVVPAKLINGHRQWRSALMGIPEDASLQFVLNERLMPVGLPAGGLLLTDYLARELQVQPGDRLTVEILEGERRRVSIPVAAVTGEFLGTGAYMRLDALNRVLRDGPLINQVLLTNHPDQELQIFRELKDTPGVLGVAKRHAMLESFYETLGKTFLTFTFFNSLLGGVIAFGVIYNTIRISLAEKGRELASLRVLGYTRQETAHILFGEVAVLLIAGIGAGWLIGQGLAYWLTTAMQTELYRVPLIITGQTFGISAAVVLVSALVSGAIAWRRLQTLDLVAVLKTRE
ncbi:FtsX-like permease family protein [Marinobacter salinisoli]|uniref:FtsX-like permease family protein n=1 Tax=Marinobacter salinisoli TaxID=2769486 RepID=A0ABX7MMV4_9GAMM|nr:FtsX-like permease family protein [Marinobacter salinisoli]QSP93561.1 FtsX-like permease family protein [Marinobacter salinisoli]